MLVVLGVQSDRLRSSILIHPRYVWDYFWTNGSGAQWLGSCQDLWIFPRIQSFYLDCDFLAGIAMIYSYWSTLTILLSPEMYAVFIAFSEALYLILVTLVMTSGSWKGVVLFGVLTLRETIVSHLILVPLMMECSALKNTIISSKS